MSSQGGAPDAAPAPWYSAFPAPKDVELGALGREEVIRMIKSADKGTQDFVLVDGGTIRGSINLPAQSLYPSMPTLYTVFKAAGVPGWFRDYISDRGDTEMQSVILLGGIKGWVAVGGEFVETMDGYDANAWAKKE
ncbi:related to arsenate reductase (Arc2) [Cephalotrichum gorgonifer]|uniref:Related to arsenate reductase (Arc2) n=1 Tax=Cephalotrichum gorgonifer TaxID=2041049 RepID=A0AAE8MUN3_9PEZI|nr:related to arsenate reductase (Arc2) [Cephalotrichum gorgonifer]